MYVFGLFSKLPQGFLPILHIECCRCVTLQSNLSCTHLRGILALDRYLLTTQHLSQVGGYELYDWEIGFVLFVRACVWGQHWGGGWGQE